MIQQNKVISYVKPFLSMVFLFFVIGFLTTANTQFQGPLKDIFLSRAGTIKNLLATLITFSWFLAYPICGVVGSSWINRHGYKSTLVRGMLLMVLGIGLFLFSSMTSIYLPSMNLCFSDIEIPLGFFIFILGAFTTGAAATILQVVINPYLTACEIKGTQSVQRLAIGGTANSLGTTIAPFFVSQIIFGGAALNCINSNQLLLSFFYLLLATLLVCVILKNLSFPDIKNIRTETSEVNIWSFPQLKLGVIAIFFYVGVEVCIGANINLYAIEKNMNSPALLATIYWGGLLVGRLIGSFLNKVSPRTQLTVTTLSSLILTVLAIFSDNIWLLSLVGLFNSIMWGAIFSLATTGLGKFTTKAAGFFMIGVIGGAILPLLQGGLADLLNGWRWTWLLVAAGYIFILFYALIGSRTYQLNNIKNN